MKRRILNLALISILVAIPTNSFAGMKKTSSITDLSTDLSASAEATQEVVEQYKATANRAPASFDQPVPVTFKKTKFNDIVPSMEEFRKSQEESEKSGGLAAH